MAEFAEENGGQEQGKKGRKRPRPGKKRTSKMKREKRGKKRAEEAAMQSSDKSMVDQAKQKKQHAKNGADPDEDLDKRVWVGGLPSDTDEQALLSHFKVCGPVKSIKLVRNSRSVFRGSCFISFRKNSGLAAAMELDGTEFKEQTIKIKKAAPPVEKPDLQVYVAGIPRNATEEVLRKDFSECGEISKFKMLQDNITSKFKGVIFVTYKTQAGVDAALKFHDTDYGGRTLDVRLASEGKPPSKAMDVTETQSAVKESGKKKKMAKTAAAKEIAESENITDENTKKEKKLKKRQHGPQDEEAIGGQGDSTGKTKKKKKIKT